MAKLKDNLNKTEVIELCSRERMNTKWRFYKWKSLTVFCCFTQTGTYGLPARGYSQTFAQNHTTNCFTFEDNTRKPYKSTRSFFLFLLSVCMQIKAWKKTPDTFNLFINRMGGLNAGHSQRIQMNDIAFVEDLLILNILLNNKFFVHETLSENLLDEVCRNTKILCDY